MFIFKPVFYLLGIILEQVVNVVQVVPYRKINIFFTTIIFFLME